MEHTLNESPTTGTTNR